LSAAIGGIVLGSAVLVAGCQQAAPPDNKAATAAKAPEPATPIEVAEGLVRQRLGAAAEIRFTGGRTFGREGVPVVCGTYAEPGRPNQRYVAVSSIEVWIEPDMRPGQMDLAFEEFCRDQAANA
jgi:hypothetical protein